ncbi:MAG: M23 family metallopeptidase, partial [Lachnospiraceae bacterium]|nr:M23 family metallopeptidase [Lachnospiraceae bacterium]
AYVLLCRDIEAACDEKVIKNKDKNFMAEYSQALLDCAVQRRRISACPVAFGETGVKGRVKGILSYKKPAFWIILVAFVAIVVTAVCFLTNPKKKDVANTLPELSVTTGNDDISYKADIREFAWTTDEKNGDSSLLQETEVHPDYDESVVVVKLNKTGNPENIALNFTMEPDKVEVKSFDDKYAENPEVIKDYISDLNYDPTEHSIEVDSEDNLYMTLRASWENQGHVSYVVHLVRDGAEEGDSEAETFADNEADNPESETLADNDADDSEENASENSDGTKEGDMGIKYEYKDGQYVVDGDQVYQYKKILTGRDRNASCSGKYVVLTNDPDITYERVSLSLFSSNMDDWLTDTIIVEMEALTDEFKDFSVWPTESELISRGFDENEHPETDIAGPTGDPIYAIADGTVISVGFSEDYGNSIVILSKDAQIRYSHLGSINVNELDEVKAGDTIATLGNTGNSTGPHLAISLITDKPHNVMDYYVKN